MLSILKERIYYILTFILIVSIFSPIIFSYRNQIRSQITNFFYPIKYNKDLALSLMEEGDKLLEYDDFHSLDKENLIESPVDLNIMKKACEYIGRTDLQDPKWLEEKNVWLVRKKIKEGKTPTYISINPQQYWDFHIDKVLQSLDYYNRAFNFSGPIFKIPKKLADVSFAACRKQQAYINYSLYVFKTENHILELLEKDNQIKPSLTKRQKNMIVWSNIKKNKIPDVSRKEYIFANLEIINSQVLPNTEIDDFYERVIFFIPQYSLKRNLYLYKRGILNSKIAKKHNNKSYYKKALLYLQGSVDFQNLKVPMQHQLNELDTIFLQRNLKIIKILSILEEKNQLISTINYLDYTVNRIKKKTKTNFQQKLLNQYNVLKKQVLLQAGYNI